MSTLEGTCKGCGRILILELDTKISRHEAPLCQTFIDMTKDMKKTRLPDREILPNGKPGKVVE
jgi:hypothetical protein